MDNHNPQDKSCILGLCFAVPLRSSGYCVGVVARSKSDESGGILLAYFFGPRLDSPESVHRDQELKAQDAILVCRCSDMNVRNNVWPTIGRLEDFSIEDWPMPVFVRINPITGGGTKVLYSDFDLQKVVSEQPANSNETNFLPKDGLFGVGAIELIMTRKLKDV